PASDPEADSTSTSECFHLSASPTIDTNQTPVTGNVGDPISDSASLHNTSNLDGTGTVKIYLYLPGQTCASDGSGGTLEATYTVTTNGPFTAGPVTATQAGVYHWLAIFSGDGNNAGPVNSGCASEPVTITAHPTIDTNQTPVTGNVGDPISDSASLHNTSNLDGTGTVTIYLFAPGVTCDITGAGGTVEANYSFVTTNGPFIAAPVTATQPHVYHWLAIRSGHGNNAHPVNVGCASEPVWITAHPTIETNQTPVTGNVSGPISDSARLPIPSQRAAELTVTIYLFPPGLTCAVDGSGGTVEPTYSNVTTNGPFT